MFVFIKTKLHLNGGNSDFCDWPRCTKCANLFTNVCKTEFITNYNRQKHVLLFVLGFEMNRPCLCLENSATSVNQPETNHTYESYMGFALTHYFAPFQCCTLNLSPRSELLVASISCLQTDVHVANRQVAASGYYRYCFQVSTLL